VASARRARSREVGPLANAAGGWEAKGGSTLGQGGTAGPARAAFDLGKARWGRSGSALTEQGKGWPRAGRVGLGWLGAPRLTVAASV
jgi:hypothetical protein